MDVTIRNIGILKNIAISCKDRDDDIWIEDNSGLAMNRILKEKVDLWKNGYWFTNHRKRFVDKKLKSGSSVIGMTIYVIR